MTKRVSLLIALSIALGIHTPCYGLYVMVRSGFGELKGENLGAFTRGATQAPTVMGITHYRVFRNNNRCGSEGFKYKDHKNLSVALGGRFDVFDIGALGLEVEILGAYANFDRKNRKKINYMNWDGLASPDLITVAMRNLDPNPRLHTGLFRLMYLKNQRIAGAQVNIYWEHYILDWLSAGIGVGIGGAYVCTKFTTLEWFSRYNRAAGWLPYTSLSNRRKYVHSGSLLYNFSLFVRAEKFETLFEVGYRHIGLHQMFGAKCYGYEIPKLANLHSDQIYLGVGRTF
ncbi:MAG: hypothetical protein MJ218_00480 [Opitutales bacterium]|nr:hypothetical protein [Opitutales bacterium]